MRLGLAAGAVVVVAGAGVGVGVAVSGGNGNGGNEVVGNAAVYLPLSTLGKLTAAPAAGALGPENVPIPSAPVLAGTSPDGIIHIESPAERTYTLGEFFDEWGQPLGPDQVGPAKGKVTAVVNGRVFKGNPRNVPLGSHENLQLDVGTPLIDPETINWSNTGL